MIIDPCDGDAAISVADDDDDDDIGGRGLTVVACISLTELANLALSVC